MNTLFCAKPTPTFLQSPIGTILDLAWSHDGQLLAAVSSRGMVAIWETTDGTCVHSQQITRSKLTAVAWSAHNRSLLLGSETGVFRLLHLATRTLAVSSTFAAPISRIAWSPNAVVQRFLVLSGHQVAVFTSGKNEPNTLQYATPVIDASWSPCGNQIALVCANGLVEVWDAQAKRMLWRKTQHQAQPRGVSWDATGQRLAIGTEQGTIEFQDITGRLQHTPLPVLPLSSFPIRTVCWGEGGLVASSGEDMVIWQGERPSNSASPIQHHRTVQALALDPQGLFLATAQHTLIAIAAL